MWQRGKVFASCYLSQLELRATAPDPGSRAHCLTMKWLRWEISRNQEKKGPCRPLGWSGPSVRDGVQEQRSLEETEEGVGRIRICLQRGKRSNHPVGENFEKSVTSVSPPVPRAFLMPLSFRMTFSYIFTWLLSFDAVDYNLRWCVR